MEYPGYATWISGVANFGGKLAQRLNLPPLRHGPDGALDHRQALAAGGAEMDEPFLENAPRHLLQDRDPPRVVLDEVIVGGQIIGDFSLLGHLRNVKFESQ